MNWSYGVKGILVRFGLLIGVFGIGMGGGVVMGCDWVVGFLDGRRGVEVFFVIFGKFFYGRFGCFFLI